MMGSGTYLRLPGAMLVVLLVVLAPTAALAQSAPVDPNPSDGLLGWLMQFPEALLDTVDQWWRLKLIEYDREASTPFLYALPMLLKYTPTMAYGSVKVLHDSFVTIGMGTAGLLFGIGWIQISGGSWIGAPLTTKQLLARFCLAVLAVKTSGDLLQWMIKFNDHIIGKIALDFDEKIFAPALQDDPTINIVLLFMAMFFRFITLFGIWALLVYRVVDLTLLWAMAPLPAAFMVLPSTSGLVRTFLIEFLAVTTQTMLFAVILVLWTSTQLWNVDGMPVTWFQNAAAGFLLWGYLKKKPEWLRGILHSSAWNYAGAVATAGQSAMAML